MKKESEGYVTNAQRKWKQNCIALGTVKGTQYTHSIITQG